MRRIRKDRYRSYPRVRIEHESGYIEVSQDYMERGPKTKVNKLMNLAKKEWRI